jgi:hypothetical protein
MTTPLEVAQWMAEQVLTAPYVYQETIVRQILTKFGSKFTYTNANGNPAINKDILKQFRKLTDGKVVWERSDRSWRKLRTGEVYKGRQTD